MQTGLQVNLFALPLWPEMQADDFTWCAKGLRYKRMSMLLHGNIQMIGSDECSSTGVVAFLPATPWRDR
jgi:hypothetical protein